MPDLSQLTGIQLADDEPVFAAPWEAQAFAMAVHLHETGLFTWDEWAEHLSAQVHGPTTRPYYEHWLAALETITSAKTPISAEAVETRTKAWEKAAAETPHGEPIELAKTVLSR